MRIELRADGAPQHPDRHDLVGRADCSARDQVGMAADIFGERIDRDVDTVGERELEERAEQGVVANDDWPMPLPLLYSLGGGLYEAEVDEGVRRIGWRLDHDHTDPAA